MMSDSILFDQDSAQRVHNICTKQSISRKKNSAKSENPEGEYRTNWKSIYIVTLVAFIGSIQEHCLMVWPYLQLMDPTATPAFYGFMRSVSGLGILVSALLAGYISNLLSNTKWPMVFSKLMAILSCLLYIFVEIVQDGRRWIFFAFELFLGISSGSAQMYKTHVAMASTEIDRTKAVGLCSLAPGVGLMAGPLIQLCFSRMSYPGVPLLFGAHINIFTAPSYLIITICIIGAILLLNCFDGRMRIAEKSLQDQKNTMTHPQNVSPLDSVSYISGTSDKVHILNCFTKLKEYDLDSVAIGVCMYTKAVVTLCTQGFFAIGGSYTMIAFQWSSEEAVIYLSIIIASLGFSMIVWNSLYVFFNFGNKFSERRAIVFSLLLLLTVYLCTYPWPFLSDTIPYQSVDTESIDFKNMSMSVNAIQDLLRGCPRRFEWCATTKRIYMPVFSISYILAFGAAYPISLLNLDTLYSKILGPIKQGTMQGIFIACGDGLNIALPVILSTVYTFYGPKPIWHFNMAAVVFGIFLWIFFYARMISKSRRLQNAIHRDM